MRWLVSPIVGDGTAATKGMTDATGPYRAKASAYGPHVADIPGATDGSPLYPWALVLFDGDVAAAEADGDLTLLPDVGMADPTPSDFTLPPFNAPVIPGKPTPPAPADAWDPDRTFGENIAAMGQLLDSTFDPARVGVG